MKAGPTPPSREYRVLSAKAVCLVGIGDHARALAEIDRAERSLLDRGEAVPARDHAGIHCNRSNILKDMDRMDDALASAEEAIRTDPGWALSHIMAIAVHASVNDFASARMAFGLRMGQLCPDYREDEGARAYLMSDLDFATVRRHRTSFTEFFKELAREITFLRLAAGSNGRGVAWWAWCFRCVGGKDAGKPANDLRHVRHLIIRRE